MAGANPSFDAATFRDGILTAMRMGAPPEVSQRATFLFRRGAQRYFRDGEEIPPPRLDQEGKPLDPTIRVESVPAREPLQTDCAVEFESATADEVPVGNFRPAKVVITLLEEEYEQVQDAIEVRLGGDVYVIGYQRPPMGLFQVGVRQFVAFARDET